MQENRSNFFVVPLLNTAGLLVSLASTAIIARTISASSFGLYQIALSIAAILSLVSLPGMAQATTQSVARGFLGTYKQNMQLVLRCCLIVSAIIFGSYLIAAKQFVEGAELLLFLSLFYTPYYGMKQWASFHNGRGKYALTAGVNFADYLLVLVSILGLVKFEMLNVTTAFTAAFVIPAILHTAGYLLTNPSEVNTKVEAGSKDYGVKTTVFSIPNILSNHTDKFILLASLDLASVGIFAVAERVTEAAKSVIQSAVSVLAPRYARSEWTHKLSREVLLYSMLGGVLILVASLLVIQPAIILIFGQSYAESASVASFMFLSLIFVVPSTMQFRFIQSKLNVGAFKRVQLSISITRIILSAILIPIWGLWGAVASTWIYRIYMVTVVQKEITRYKGGIGDVSPSKN